MARKTRKGEPATALHDWVCDHCGKKIYKRRKIPKRCHHMPMRPMGNPWKGRASKDFYKYAEQNPGWIASLPDDYWVSDKVLARLQKIVEEDGLKWSGSIRSSGPYEADKYEVLP